MSAMARRWRLLTGSVLLAGGLAVGGAAWMARHWLATPLSIAPGATERLVIARGDSFARVAGELAERDLLEHPRWLTWLARHRGDAVRIQAGEYELDGQLTPSTLLDKLVNGDVVLHSIVLIEGWDLRRAIAAVRKHPHVQATTATQSPDHLRELIGVVPGTPDCRGDCTWADLEGQLYPDTYRFPSGTQDVDVLRRARETLESVLAQTWAGRAESLPLSNAYEALTLASIVEKETGLAEERPRIAGVFIRRLRQGMRLQSDPTVIYGVGEDYAGDITRAHLRDDTPYNTYTRGGLPPTPIALVGRAAIEAVAHPDEGTALYFVATGAGDGSHYFSATLAEHNEAVQRYLSRQANADTP
jgi:UPF0755 protein